MTETSTMRALVVDEAGAPLRERRHPRPRPGPREVLVRVHASGTNPLDTKIRAGAAPHARHPLPAILGIDFAGVVAAVGAQVEGFQEGDEVYGIAGGVGGIAGSLAEYAAVDVDLVARKPRNLSMREAAALPLVAITAWEGLVDRAATQAGQTVLVHGGAGGVGHVAVQMAVALGAQVWATVSPGGMDLVRRHGATPIDRTTSTVEGYVASETGGRGFDVVYDTVGGAVLDTSFAAVRLYGGHVVSCLGWGTHKLAPLSFRAATYSGVFTLLPLLSGEGRAHQGDILRRTAHWVEAGRLRPWVDERRYHFGNATEAHGELEAGRARGKIVIDVPDAP